MAEHVEDIFKVDFDPKAYEELKKEAKSNTLPEFYLVWCVADSATLNYKYFMEVKQKIRNDRIIVLSKEKLPEELEGADHQTGTHNEKIEYIEKFINKSKIGYICLCCSSSIYNELSNSTFETHIGQHNCTYYGLKPRTVVKQQGEINCKITEQNLLWKEREDMEVIFNVKIRDNIQGQTVEFSPKDSYKYYTVVRHKSDTLTLVLSLKGTTMERKLPGYTNDQMNIIGIDPDAFKSLHQNINNMVYISFGCTAINPLVAALDPNISI